VTLEIVTPEKKVFEGNVKLVKVPGTKGSFAILNNHAPLVSTLVTGVVKVILNNNTISYIEIKGGVIEVNKNRITILTDG
jgi:F-type H+-transporting ATPase subunit epsilon